MAATFVPRGNYNGFVRTFLFQRFSYWGEIDLDGQPLAAKAEAKARHPGGIGEWRIHDVMGLVLLHEGEYRRCHPFWCPAGVEITEEWQKLKQPAVGGLDPDHPLFTHHQLQLQLVTSAASSNLQIARQMAKSGSGSTIVRRSAGQSLTAVAPSFEARNVFIINFPEVLLLNLSEHTAEELHR